jgi:DNA-binding PadR family transcriptional regulator
MSPRRSTINSSSGIGYCIERKKPMPPRASHLPTHAERIALQKLRAGNELSLRELEPTSRLTIAKMSNKGWIERGASNGIYRITQLGQEALRAMLPLGGQRLMKP